MTITAKKSPNWLFGGLILVSIGVHAVVLLHFAGFFRPKQWTAIELTLRTTTPSRVRDIPRPPKRQEAPPPAITAPASPTTRAAVVHPRPMRLKPERTPGPEPLAVPIEPVTPEVAPSPPIAQWQPEAPSSPTAVAPPEPDAPASSDDAGSYFSLVRLSIESRKTYPVSARRRNIQGRVTVEFRLEPDGRASALRVVGSSGNAALDRAALKAVREAAPFPEPPAGLVPKPVRLQIAITFELR